MWPKSTTPPAQSRGAIFRSHWAHAHFVGTFFLNQYPCTETIGPPLPASRGACVSCRVHGNYRDCLARVLVRAIIAGAFSEFPLCRFARTLHERSQLFCGLVQSCFVSSPLLDFGDRFDMVRASFIFSIPAIACSITSTPMGRISTLVFLSGADR